MEICTCIIIIPLLPPLTLGSMLNPNKYKVMVAISETKSSLKVPVSLTPQTPLTNQTPAEPGLFPAISASISDRRHSRGPWPCCLLSAALLALKPEILPPTLTLDIYIYTYIPPSINPPPSPHSRIILHLSAMLQFDYIPVTYNATLGLSR